MPAALCCLPTLVPATRMDLQGACVSRSVRMQAGAPRRPRLSRGRRWRGGTGKGTVQSSLRVQPFVENRGSSTVRAGMNGGLKQTKCSEHIRGGRRAGQGGENTRMQRGSATRCVGPAGSRQASPEPDQSRRQKWATGQPTERRSRVTGRAALLLLTWLLLRCRARAGLAGCADQTRPLE